MTFEADASYLFTVSADDAVRVWVGGDMLIERWEGQPERTIAAVRYMAHGSHPIIVEYADKSGAAAIHFSWKRETQPTPTPTPKQPAILTFFDPNVVVRWGGPNESWYERSHGFKGKICYDVGPPPCLE
jgi:hypothetical protein